MITLYIRKIKMVNNIADYEYIVMADAEKITSGRIAKQHYKDGWAPLVKRIAEQHMEVNDGPDAA